MKKMNKIKKNENNEDQWCLLNPCNVVAPLVTSQPVTEHDSDFLLTLRRLGPKSDHEKIARIIINLRWCLVEDIACPLSSSYRPSKSFSCLADQRLDPSWRMVQRELSASCTWTTSLWPCIVCLSVSTPLLNSTSLRCQCHLQEVSQRLHGGFHDSPHQLDCANLWWWRCALYKMEPTSVVGILITRHSDHLFHSPLKSVLTPLLFV